MVTFCISVIMHIHLTIDTHDVHRVANAKGETMNTLTVTARGQVTFRKDVLLHLGIKPGEKIRLDLLPDGRGVLKADRPSGSIDDFIGVLAGKTKKVASLDEINEAIAQGWSSQAKRARG